MTANLILKCIIIIISYLDHPQIDIINEAVTSDVPIESMVMTKATREEKTGNIFCVCLECS